METSISLATAPITQTYDAYKDQYSSSKSGAYADACGDLVYSLTKDSVVTSGSVYHPYFVWD